MSKTLKLTLDLQNTICSFIRGGGFPQVASEAAGVPKEVFEEWLKRGESKKKTKYHKPFILFRLAVIRAQAEARLAAEIKAHEEAPLIWLKQGPGKEREGSAGWTIAVKPSATTTNHINLLLSPEMQGILSTLLNILAPYPEARAAVAQALAGVEPPKQIESHS